MIKNILIMILMALSSSACSIFAIGEEEYACKGYPSKKNCLSAREIYALTNYKDSLEEDTEAEQPSREAADDIEEDDDAYLDDDETVFVENASPQKRNAAAQAQEQAPAVPRVAGGTLPIRTTAKVMRIWVAPWEDKKGVFHTPGLVFKEIEQRRWTLGSPSYNNVKYLSPR